MILSGKEFQERVAICNPSYQHLYQMYATAVDNYDELQRQSPAHSVPMAIYMQNKNMICIAMLPEIQAEEDEDMVYAHALEYLKVISC